MTTTGGKAFVDTNVLLRATISAQSLTREAEALIQQQLKAGVELWVSRQIIREYLVQVTRPQSFMEPLSFVEVQQRFNDIHNVFHIADETAEVTAQLLQLLKQYPTGGKQVHDANIVATMLVNGVDTLLTMNVADFRRFEDRIRLVPLAADAP